MHTYLASLLQNIEVKTTEMAQGDLQKYHKVGDFISVFPKT